MDALAIVSAVVLSFGATYYLGKGSLMLFLESLEQSRRLPAASRADLPARALRSADTLVG